MHAQNFAELNEYLKQFVPGSIQDGDFYNPDKMYKLLPLIGSPEEKFKVIHVAGTSGKTSTCYYISEMLRASGAKVGLSVSPHIFEINERVQINGKPLPELEICKLFNEFIATPKLVDLKPTYFELLVCFAFWVFAKLGCTHVVIEVGLGGLKDATNVIKDPNKVAIITDIGLDHTHILGDTIEKIAHQKAGIINKDNHVFCYQQGEIVDTVIDENVKTQSATLHRLDQNNLEAQFAEHMPDYQKRNWLLAKQVSEFVIARDNLKSLDDQELKKSQQIVIPGRMQRVTIDGKTLIFDGAHNPQKLQAFTTSLKAIYPHKTFALLSSFVESKKPTLTKSLETLHSVSDNVIATEFLASADLPHKVIPADELEDMAKQAGFKKVQKIPDAEEAFKELKKQPEDIMVITGSFYLIGSLYKNIKEYL